MNDSHPDYYPKSAKTIYANKTAFSLSQTVRELTGSAHASVVYEALYQHVSWKPDSYGTCYPSIPTLAKMSMLSERTIMRILPLLEQHGVIEIIRSRRPDGVMAVNRYKLLITES